MIVFTSKYRKGKRGVVTGNTTRLLIFCLAEPTKASKIGLTDVQVFYILYICFNTGKHCI